MSVIVDFLMGCGELDENCRLFISDRLLPYFLNQEIDTDDIIAVLESKEGTNAADTCPKYDNCIGLYNPSTQDFLILRLDINEYNDGFFLKLIHCMKMSREAVSQEEMPMFIL